MNLGATKNEILRQTYSLKKSDAIESVKLQAYLGSPYEVLGLSGPQIRKIINEIAKTNQEISPAQLNALTDSLWSGKTFEEKILAISLLGRFPKLLDSRSWTMMDRWIEDCSGWALCDGLGSGPLSRTLRSNQTRFEEVLSWTKAHNYWRRRISAYAMHDFVFAGELDKPFLLLERILYDQEFWVQRAVGTWLRECWKRDRKRTERFLIEHVKGLPRVVITVATERTPKSFREKLRKMR